MTTSMPTPWQVILMTNKTKVMKAGLTGLTGIVGAGVAAGVIAVLAIVPLPGFTGEAPALTLAPTASDQQRVCQGPLVQVLPSTSEAATFLSNGPAELSTYSPSSQVTETNLDAVDNLAPEDLGRPSVVAVPAVPDSEEQPLLSGNQLQTAVGDELSGLAGAACAEPSNDAWLVGGATDLGRTTLVMLSNPTDVTATVTMSVWSEMGLIEAITTEGLIVLPGEQRIVSLAAYAPDAIAPVVHVVSTGGRVLASLQHSVMRTLQPSGVEWVNPGVGPNTTQVMPGVFLMSHHEHDDSEMGAVLSDIEPAVRVLAPGKEDADVTVTVLSESGETIEIESRLKANTVVQFPFIGIEDGIYTVIVTADKPIVAAVRTVQDADADPAKIGTHEEDHSETPAEVPAENLEVEPIAYGGGDFTWFSPSARLVADTVLPLPAGANPLLTLYNPSPKVIEVTVSAGGQQDVVLTLDPKQMASTQLQASTRYTLTGTAGLIGGLTYIGTGVGSSIALNPANVLGTPITVYPR
jgi:hypothetical protein